MCLCLLLVLLSACTNNNTSNKTGNNNIENSSVSNNTTREVKIYPKGVTYAIDFENPNLVVDRKINFNADKTITNRYMNFSPPLIPHDGVCWKVEYADVPNYTNWCIAGIHFDMSVGTKEHFINTKMITFEFNSEVEYPQVKTGYGFYVEFAWKVVTKDGVKTDADFIKYTIPFGIPNTDGEWKKAKIVIDDVIQERFSGIDEDFEGNIVETDYALEWMMIGPTWNVSSEIWDSTGRGTIMIDNIYFWDETDDPIPEWGDAIVETTDIDY